MLADGAQFAPQQRLILCPTTILFSCLFFATQPTIVEVVVEPECYRPNCGRIGLAHSTFTSGATELIVRSADGVLRRCRNLCLSAMLEAVRASAGRTIDIDVDNRVLIQPNWQNQVDLTDF